MRKVSEKTLKLIIEELPSLKWEEAEIRDLVFPRFGVITTFQDFLQETEKLEQIDLEDISPYADPRSLGRKSGIF
jgi:hypothetical protein